MWAVGSVPTVFVASCTSFGNKTDVELDILRFFYVTASVDLIKCLLAPLSVFMTITFDDYEHWATGKVLILLKKILLYCLQH